MDTWKNRRAELQQYARTFDRSAILLPHSHWFFRVLLFLAFWIPRGAFAQTVGPLVGIPDEWDYDKVCRLIPHEVAGHIRQFRWFGLWIHPWVGVIPMGIVYGLIFFPVGLAYFRYRLELHADIQRWKVVLRSGDWTPETVLARARRFAETVSGKVYLWAWFKPLVMRGFEKAARRVIIEESRNAAR
jgi:hypothetical protein